MAEEHRSPIERLGYRGWNQYGTFKSHLMLPLPYLRVVVKNYRDLVEVPIVLPRLVAKIDEHLWSNMNDKERIEQFFKAKGVPVPYIRDDSAPIGGVKVSQAYESVIDNLGRFMSKPMTLYIHSGFENGALKAASNIVKQAIRENVDARMVGFGALLDEVKTWDAKSEILKKANSAPLLCLYMVGKEYQTDFTRATLDGILSSRYAEGKTTIITSHLDLNDFAKRYGFTPQAVPLKFEDEKITATVEQLLAFMRN